MRGTILGSWPHTWHTIWEPLADSKFSPPELFSELYPELLNACKPPKPDEDLTVVSEADHIVASPKNVRDTRAATDPVFALDCFRTMRPEEFSSERKLVRFFEQSNFIIEDFGVPQLGMLFSDSVSSFLNRYNLRYHLISPFQIVPRLPEMVSGMLQEIERNAAADQHLSALNNAVHEAFEDLSTRGRTTDIANCISRVCNLAEGFARKAPGVTQETLGAASREINCWPHATIQKSLSTLYGFCSDYPGLRHSGNSYSKIRDLEVRDALIISMLFMSFAGYLCEIDFYGVLGLKTDTADE